MGKTSIKGIVLGIGFNIIASIALIFTVALVFSVTSEIPMENQAGFDLALQTSVNVRIAFLVGGLLIAFGMGYVAERFASSPGYINAAICGVLLTLFNIIYITANPEGAPIWSQIIIILGVLPLSIAGGYIAIPKTK